MKIIVFKENKKIFDTRLQSILWIENDDCDEDNLKENIRKEGARR